MEKKLGLLKEFAKLPEHKKEEIRQRRAMTGKQIHLQNVQAREQYEQEWETQQYQKRVLFWEGVGMSSEEAAAKTDEEYRLENEKWEKKAARKMKLA